MKSAKAHTLIATRDDAFQYPACIVFIPAGNAANWIAKKTINAASVRFGVAALLDLLPDDSLRENERFSRSLSVMSFGVSIYLVDQPTEGLMPRAADVIRE